MEKNYKKLCPFKGWALENFPFIEADFDAITNYELLCKIVEYLNKTSSQFNDMIDNINYLNSWFNNLDVQDEVDNKLDEMVESGQLQEIIASYLSANALWCFDNVESMIEAPNLIDGSFAQTLGYYAKDDGGSALYKIRNVTTEDLENPLVIVINEELVAELIDNDGNPLKFGAKGDGLTDDSEAFEKLISTFDNHYVTKTINLPRKKYLLSEPIPITSGLVINGNNAEITFTGNKAFSWDDWNDVVWNCEINDLQINGNNSTIMFSGTTAFRGGRINNVRANNMGLIFNSVQMLSTMINNCNFNTKTLFGTLTFHDGTVNETYFNCTETAFNNNSCLELYGSMSNFNGCFFNGAPASGTPTFIHGHSLNGYTFSKCNFDYSDGFGFQSTAGRGLTLDNCTFRGNGRDTVNSNAYIKNESGELKVTKCSFQPKHDETFADNPDAFILISNGYSTPALFVDNNYQVNFDYKSEANPGADKIIFNEKELYYNNLIPISNSLSGTLKAGLTLYQNLDGYYLTGTNVESSTMYLLGTYNSSATIFTLPAGTYRVRTGSKQVGLQLRDADGNHNYNENAVITLANDMAVRSVALIINTNTHDKQIIYGLYK